MTATRIATALVPGDVADPAGEAASKLRAQLSDAQPVLVCVFASPAHDLGRLVAAFARPGTVAIGASTAGEFIETGDAKGAVAAFALAGDDFRVSAGIGTGLRADPARAIAHALEGQPGAIEGFAHRTALTLLDPLAGNGEEVVMMLSEELGPETPLAGGAAGDDLHMKETRVACGDRVGSDALVVAQIFSRRPLGIGVDHGHRPLSAPLRVTRASGGTIHEIEGRPAWDVWRERTAEAAKKRGIDVDHLTPEGEGAFLLQFEAGLAKGDQYKIRAPLSRTADGAISFAAAIPEGALLRITESDSGSQVASAISAARRAREALGGAPVAGALMFDCICRNLILGDEFKLAIRGASEVLGGARLAGFETYGEVGLGTGELSGFHNTTSVVLAFPGSDG